MINIKIQKMQVRKCKMIKDNKKNQNLLVSITTLGPLHDENRRVTSSHTALPATHPRCSSCSRMTPNINLNSFFGSIPGYATLKASCSSFDGSSCCRQHCNEGNGGRLEKKQRAILALPLPLSTSRVQTKYLSRWIRLVYQCERDRGFVLVE